MQELITKDNKVEEWIKSVILKYCPIVDDRYDILHTYNAPALDIDIYINKNSIIRFLFGTLSHKASIPERSDINRLVTLKEIINLIDYLIFDHEVISNFDVSKSQDWLRENTLELNLSFSINWSDKTLKGLSVDRINLKINFGKDYKTAKDYILAILNKYKSKLEKTGFYQEKKEAYFLQIKNEYFKMLSKQELLAFIRTMNENDIRDLILEMDNDLFEYYFNNLDKNNRKKYDRTN